MLLSKDLIGVFMTSTWISCSLALYLFLCVHVYLWTYILVIGIYLETYTHENSYFFNWYSNSLVTTPCSPLIPRWSLKGTSFIFHLVFHFTS